MKCLHERAESDLAFVRHGYAALYAHNNKSKTSDFQLLCPDGSVKPVAKVETTSLDGSSNSTLKHITASDPACNWGKVPSRLLMTSLARPKVSLKVKCFF